MIKRGAAETDTLDYEDILGCVHCGLCLFSCPTYRELGTEMGSPRGRLYLIRAMADNRIPMTDNFIKHVYLCLDCRACETACPSGVRFGELIEVIRAKIERSRRRSLFERLTRHIVLRKLFISQRKFAHLSELLRLYQILGIQRLVRSLAIFNLLPESLAKAEALLPRIPKRALRRPSAEVEPAVGGSRYRVSFFPGCIMSLIFGNVVRATVRVLTENGCEVVTPKGQRCCGALHAHHGERETARSLARHNIDLFNQAGVESVIVNCAGCGSMLKEYKDLLRDDLEYAGKAEALSDKVEDISEFLTRVPLNGRLGEIRARVAYDEPCHLLHAQKVSEQPKLLLKTIPGLELVQTKEADQCCGSAGIYNLTHYDLSMKLLDRKMENIAAARPDVIASGNPGCMLQLRLGVERANIKAEVVHPVELLDRAYSAAGQSSL